MIEQKTACGGGVYREYVCVCWNVSLHVIAEREWLVEVWQVSVMGRGAKESVVLQKRWK